MGREFPYQKVNDSGHIRLGRVMGENFRPGCDSG